MRCKAQENCEMYIKLQEEEQIYNILHIFLAEKGNNVKQQCVIKCAAVENQTWQDSA